MGRELRPEVQRMQAEARRKQVWIVAAAAIATGLVFLIIEAMSG